MVLSFPFLYPVWQDYLKFNFLNGSLSFLFFCILDEPPCYVRQCTLMCIFTLVFFTCKLSRVSRGFCTIVLYMHWAYINLCSFFGFPILRVLDRIRGLAHIKTQTHTYSKLRFHLFTTYRNVHKSLLIWTLCWLPFYLCVAFCF